MPVTSQYPLKPARNPPSLSIFDYMPALGLIRWHIKKLLRLEISDREKRKRKKRMGRNKGQPNVESAISLEIFLALSK